MRVLIVSYYFPPAAGGGVQRVLKWCKFLPDSDVEVHVLTPDDPKWLDTGGGLTVPPNTVVHRTRNLAPAAVRPSDVIAQAGGRIRRLWRTLLLQPRRLLVPDVAIAWSLTSVRQGIRVVRKHDIDLVISTSPPETCHVIARRISRATGVPWIADFRDSWLDLPHLRTDRLLVRLKHRYNTRLATRMLRHASTITTVSKPLAQDLTRRHPDTPVHVIPNGIDLDDLQEIPPPLPLQSDVHRSDRCVIAYTGNFFGRQSPQRFLDATAALLERRPALIDQLVIRFVGGLKPEDHALIDGSPALRSVIERIPFSDYRDVLAEQAAADILLLYVAPGANSQGVYTGKVFEYVAAQRPVLALVPHDNVCVDLLTRAGTGHQVEPDDVSAISATMEQLIDQRLNHGRVECRVDTQVLDSISRKHQAEELAELIGRICADHQSK